MTELNYVLDLAMSNFMQLGVKSVSMDDISKSLGISKKTLYQHFKNKEDLVLQSISRHISLEQILLNDITAHSGDALEEMVQIAEYTVIHFREIKPTLIYDLQKYYRDIWNNVMLRQTQFYTNKIRENIKQGITEGYYRPDADSNIVAKLYVAKSVSLVNEELFPQREYQRDHLIRQHILYHIHGILSDIGRQYISDFDLFKT